MSEIVWILVGFGAVVALYFLYQAGFWLYERCFLHPEERWRRRYDRKLKKHFRSL